MAKKIGKFIGMKINDFNDLLKEKQIIVRPAKLIPPTIKAGDEIALTSIFLSAIKLIKEFREDLFSDLKFRKNGSHYFYTEACFADCPDSRPDGLIINAVSGKIQDAIIIEVKNKHIDIDDDQIQKYIELAKNIGISKILTISNQFVSDPSQSPCKKIKIPKGMQLYHFSWTYILTIAQLLLFKNDHNIADEDQVNLMQEVFQFLSSKESGITSFTQMKPGWKDVAKSITSGRIPKKNDTSTDDAIISWQQEEKDMALQLSQKLGILVRTTNRQDSKTRWESDFKSLSTKKILLSKLKVENAVSPVEILAHFERRTISMSIQVEAPDKTIRGQIGWLKKQIESCENKNSELYNKLKEKIHFEPLLKYRNLYPVTKIDKIDDVIDDLKGKEITGFSIIYINHLGVKFENQKKFVEIIEEMLIDYFSGIVQYITNPPKKSPQIPKNKQEEVPEEVKDVVIDAHDTKE